MEYLSSKLLEACEFAAAAHEGQKRKNISQTPYFSHPAAVACIVIRAGYPEEVVVAALLHDVVEDTSVKIAEVAGRFGPRVAQLVMGVTEDKRLSWHDRNRSYNEHLRLADEQTAALSAADMLANRRSLLLEFSAGNNPWVCFSSNPKEYARDRLDFDRERLQIIMEKVHHDFVLELAELQRQIIAYTGRVQWN